MTISAEETPKTMETDGKANGPSQSEDIPGIDEQCRIIKGLLQENLRKGETWYVKNIS